MPACPRLPAALFAASAAWFALLGTAVPVAADTHPNREAGTPSGNWVTTGGNVAATTFTQATPPGVSLYANVDETKEMSAHFLRLSPKGVDSTSTAINGTTFSPVSEYGDYVSSTLGTESVVLGDGVAAAVVPEPGPMVTVVVLGFMTGVALLRGQTRTVCAVR